jgi:hypothetical protein
MARLSVVALLLRRRTLESARSVLRIGGWGALVPALKHRALLTAIGASGGSPSKIDISSRSQLPSTGPCALTAGWQSMRWLWLALSRSDG